MAAIDQDLLLFAIPKKGRLYKDCTKILEGIGISYKRQARLDIAYSSNMPIKLVFLGAKDIARFVGEGNVDLGITGQDMVQETGVDINELMPLGFGACRLAVQAPVKDNYKGKVESLAGKRVATSFPHLTKMFFDKLNPNVETPIRVIGGSVEAACALGLADCVVDLVETGTTMRAAGLEEIATVITTQAALVGNKKSKHQDLINKLIGRIRGFLAAQQYSMIYYNITTARVPDASKITPGMRAPTVTPLSDANFVAMSAMVKTKEISHIMDELEDIGATDVFVMKMENCRVGREVCKPCTK